MDDCCILFLGAASPGGALRSKRAPGELPFTAPLVFLLLLWDTSQTQDTFSTASEEIFLTDINPGILIDMFRQTPSYVYIAGTYEDTSHNISFSCSPNSLRALNNIRATTHLKLCCSIGEDGDSRCQEVTSLDSSVECNGLQLYYSHASVLFTLLLPPLDDRSNGARDATFYCLLHASFDADENLVIRSGLLTLRDALAHAANMDIQGSSQAIHLLPRALDTLDFPLALACGNLADSVPSWPPWMTSVWSQTVLFEWVFCHLKTDSPMPLPVCAKTGIPLYTANGSSEEFLVSPSSTLYITSGQALRGHPNTVLMCRYAPRRVAVSTYAARASTDLSPPLLLEGFSFVPGVSSSTSDKINRAPAPTPVPPAHARYVLLEGSTLRTPFRLFGVHRQVSGLAGGRILWFKDGVPVTGSHFSLQLPQHIDRSLAGVYEQWILSADGRNLTSRTEIVVVGPPRLTADCIPELTYVFEGSYFSALCRVKGLDTARVKIGVNGCEGSTLRELADEIRWSAKPPMSKLDLKTASVLTTEGGEGRVEFRVESLLMGQSFHLTIRAFNAFGESHQSGTVLVIAKPVLSRAPAIASCVASDCGTEPYTVPCVLEESYVQRLNHRYNITVRQDWLINRQWTLDSLANSTASLSTYFMFDPTNPTSLAVSPVRPFPTSNSERKGVDDAVVGMEKQSPPLTLEEAMALETRERPLALHLECRVRLYLRDASVSFQTPPHLQSARLQNKHIIFDSSLEFPLATSLPAVASAFTALRRFVPESVEQESAHSSTYLRFAAVSGASQDSNLYLSAQNPSVHLDASQNSSRSIYILDIDPRLSLTFSCFSNYRVGLLRRIEFCCGRHGLPPACHDLVATASPRQGGLSICPDLPDTLHYSYQLTTGAILNLTMNPVFQRKSGYSYTISCRLSDAHSFLESAPLLLRDAGHFVYRLMPPTTTTTNSTEIVAVNETEPPHFFTCGDLFTSDWPAWMTTLWLRLVPFQWGFCRVGEGGISVTACAASAAPLTLPHDGAILSPEGHLALFEVEPNSAVVCLSTRTGKALRIFAAEAHGSIIRRGLGTPAMQSEPISGDTATTALNALSPTRKEYALLEGGPPPAAAAADFYLLFLYRVTRGRPKYTWLRNGRVLQFTQLQEAFAYPLFFPSPPSFSVCCLSGLQAVAGTYQLLVSSFVSSRREPVGSLHFTALVRVLRPVRLFCTPLSRESAHLIAEGSAIEVRCEVTPVAEDLQVSAELQSMRTGQRRHLDFLHDPLVRTFVEEEEEDRRVVVFHRHNCSLADGDFRLLLRARNQWGVQHADIVIRVFPIPVVTLTPQAIFCPRLCDSSAIEVSFKDRLRAVWRDDYAIYPALSWSLVGPGNLTDVSSDPDLRPFFQVDHPDESSLLLLPDPAGFNASGLGSLLASKGVGDPKTAQFYLQLRIQLFWDPSGAGGGGGDERHVVYDTATVNDPAQSTALRVLLNFGEKSEKVSPWLLGTISGVICLLLLLLPCLLLLGLLCRRRRPRWCPFADSRAPSARPGISYPLERPETPRDDQPEALALLQHPFSGEGKQSVGLPESSPVYATVPLPQRRTKHVSSSTSVIGEPTGQQLPPTTNIYATTPSRAASAVGADASEDGKGSKRSSTVVPPPPEVPDPEDGVCSATPEPQAQEAAPLPALSSPSVEAETGAQTGPSEEKSTDKPRRMRVSRDRKRMKCRPIDFKLEDPMSGPTDPPAAGTSSSTTQHITEDLLMEDLDDLVFVRSRLSPRFQREDSDSSRSITQIFLNDP
ncbi:hypothetical protein SprV_0902740300 [Sparganum proliferum]